MKNLTKIFLFLFIVGIVLAIPVMAQADDDKKNNIIVGEFSSNYWEGGEITNVSIEVIQSGATNTTSTLRTYDFLSVPENIVIQGFRSFAQDLNCVLGNIRSDEFMGTDFDFVCVETKNSTWKMHQLLSFPLTFEPPADPTKY